MSSISLEELLEHIAQGRDTLVDLQRNLVSIPALGPENGGQGELEKVEYLTELLRSWSVTNTERIDAPDNRVPSGVRPSLAAVLPGADTSRTLWIISHTDVVPAGDLSLWTGDPFELRVEGDTLIGRGVEDNHGGLVSSLLLAKVLLENGVTPPMNYGMLFVADEENGSRYGLEHVLHARPDLFGANDLFIVPDFGAPDSTLMEVAEKSMLWVKVTVHGRQCHASTPDAGVNTLRAAADYILKLEELHERFPARATLFDPDRSTFEPTKKDANVPNVNTIPGTDVFYMDCRVLPDYDLDDVLAAFRELADDVEQRRGVQIDLDRHIFDQAAPPTPADSEVVLRLASAIRTVYDIEPEPKGIGGGTVAAFLRRMGYPAVVWSTCLNNAHQPDEKASIENLVKDAQVFLLALLGD